MLLELIISLWTIHPTFFDALLSPYFVNISGDIISQCEQFCWQCYI